MAGVSNTDGMKIEAAGACFKFVVYAMCHVEKGGLSEQGKSERPVYENLLALPTISRSLMVKRITMTCYAWHCPS
jgi:hypothetical protein